MRRITAVVIAAMLAFNGLGDVATTAIIFQRPDLVEVNPFARWAYAHAGMVGVAARKVVVLGLALASFPLARRAAESRRLQELADRHKMFALWPAYLTRMPVVAASVLTLFGVVATVNNLLLIL